jgi:hypothetical protein
MKKETNSIEFTHERTLKLRLPKFTLSKNIQYLDPLKLSKGSHTIELGKFEDCGCDCTVGATIKNGMMTGIKYPRCKHTQPIPPKAAKAMVAARKKLTKKARRKWQDIPVGDIINNTAVARLNEVIIDQGDCVMICWELPFGRGEQCMICCGLDAPLPSAVWCIGPSEPVLRL